MLVSIPEMAVISAYFIATIYNGTWRQTLTFSPYVGEYVFSYIRWNYPKWENFSSSLDNTQLAHSPYFLRGRVHISLLCPPSSLYACVWVYVWGCVIWSACPGLGFHQFFIVPGHREHVNTDDPHVPTSPFWYTPYLAWGLNALCPYNYLAFKNCHHLLFF